MSMGDTGDMSIDEIALRAALNVLRDSVESKRMPSGLPLDAAALDLHQQAIEHLEPLLQKVQTGAAWRPRAPRP